MATEKHSLFVAINANAAKAGARVYRTATKTITKSSSLAVRAIKGVTSALNPLSMGVGKLKALLVTGGLGLAVTKSVTTFASFEKQMAQVNTMLSESTEKFLPEYTTAVRDMSREFGEATETLSRGLYDILSASVPAEHALATLEVAAKAAAGGITTTGVAADAITTILNSYRLSADKAGDVSDLLFAIVKRGKTTFAELAPAIGKVAAISSVAGLSLEEMGAALSTMTRAGVRTDIAITGLKSIINTFLSPTQDSIDAVRRLGLEFDLTSNALKHLGLTGVLKQMKDLSAEDIAAVFPNIRAMTGIAPAIQQIGNQMEDLAFMTNRAGVATEAYEKIASTTSFTFGKFKESIKAAWEMIGEGFAPLYKADAERISKYLKENESSIKYYARVVAIQVEKIQDYFIAFVRYLKDDFSSASDAAMQLFLEGLKLVAKSAGSIGSAAGAAMLQGFKSALAGDNTFNQAVKKEFEQRMGKTFSTKMGSRVAIQSGLFTPDIYVHKEDMEAWNKVAGEVAEVWETDTMPTMYARMEGSLKGHMDQFTVKKKQLFEKMGKTDSGVTAINDFDIARQKAAQNMQIAELEKHGIHLESVWETIVGKVTGWKNKLFPGAAESPLAGAAAKGEEWVGKEKSSQYTPSAYTGEEISAAESSMADLNGELKMEMETIWMANEARERSIKAREYENAALVAYNGNVEDAAAATDKYKESLEKIGDIEKFKELAEGIGSSFSSAFENIVNGSKSVEDAFRDMASNIAANIMQKMLFDPIAEMLTQFIIKAAMAGFGGGAGAVAGAAVANGGVFVGGRLTPFARGGIVSRPTIFPMANGMGLMGEAGPEAVMPLSRGSNGKLGVASSQPEVKVNIVNVTDKNEVANVLSSPEGTKIIMNTLQKNKQSSRRMLS